jgi:hyperosmotically inducible periplasmic protein
MNKFVYFATLAIVSFASLSAGAQTSTDPAPADNSSANKSDSHMSASADAQKNDQIDLRLARQIRQSLIADKSLSTYAHNVKVVAVDGNVTLNGVVRSTDEKSSVEAKAVSIAGQGHVVDQMTIAPPKS